MNSSLYISATGMKTHTAGMQTLSSNLANVSTVGYKQQSMLFEDMMYQDLPAGSSWSQVCNQRGAGVEVGSVRTLFTEGSFEPSNTVTDMALEGRGFFEVVRDGQKHYTRAGNFRFNAQGFLNDPNGYTLTGTKMVNGQPSGGLQPIQLDMNDVGVLQNPPKVTTAATSTFNLGFTTDSTTNTANPNFALLEAWNGTKSPPLDTDMYGYSQPVRVYDANGKPHTATMYFDGTPSGTGGQKVYEYVVALNPSEDGSGAAGTQGAGLLMAGTLTFSSTGELVDQSAFSPSGGDYKNLANWTPSPLVNGRPQVNMTATGGANVQFSLNLGITGAGNAWSNAPASAADVGTDPTKLPSLGTVTRESTPTTARGSSSNNLSTRQDGYGVGEMSNMYISEDGKVMARYTNGQETALYGIPVFRFTSEDGLRREGMNHYSATEESGKMEYGVAGTENYGKIRASTLELSNVDMSREMVNMIIMQRGFQMNSKGITTTDSMIQKALEIKR